jgi:hypothetical protein
MENPMTTKTLTLNQDDLCNFDIVYHKSNGLKLTITKLLG